MRRMGTSSVLLRSQLVMDRRTKQVSRRAKPGQIAIIDHSDVDELAAVELIEAKVSAVINSSAFLTGLYPAAGAKRLLEAGILLYQNVEPLFERSEGEEVLYEGCEAAIAGTRLFVRPAKEWIPCSLLIPVTHEQIEKQMEEAAKQSKTVLSSFLDNTFEYVAREKALILEPLSKVSLRTRMAERHVVVVSRGKYYKEDVQLIRGYIDRKQPVIIAVDGAADALLDLGIMPDLIIGDMDSLSDQALCCGAELVVHAYLDGRAPGGERVEALGLPFVRLPAPGTSEDAALLLADDQQASLIVSVGTHSSMIDFLEKGRKGMGSTLLTRAKLGSKLIDARGLSQLTQMDEVVSTPVRQPRLFETLYTMVKEWRAQREQSEHRDSGI
ncbi:putative cytokinetic ring protein SteA [Brevibacillus fluminis]|uniref:putative cytokinetic ring protein SteA n=1 Tax=Brevibacillus fluminis TaxID=511487 RepID=UPI001FE821CB|nr:putative cytokinetic ring protein SteA [Brevibacillus fluminis]